ncbi:hypothetical protein CCAX7_45050 [Capsulimonas corticalis]|uniref:Uncharacterized protein n=1 Tax=Capsulimonas corticalis TaxID=2219043 RepID=A0A402D6I9_9BACT|nr:hypothetical protein [Capsulimonas corticalis]BDI32454.1 hypothetical protein CCAX7_45050 [Capsulimonas corticalis]
MSERIKPSGIVAIVILVIAAISFAGYRYFAPQPYTAPAPGSGMTLAKLVAKAEKDPGGLTPTEKQYYSRLSPAAIAAIKNSEAKPAPGQK